MYKKKIKHNNLPNVAKKKRSENYFKSFEGDSNSKVKGGLRRSEQNMHLNTALLGCPKIRGENQNLRILSHLMTNNKTNKTSLYLYKKDT